MNIQKINKPPPIHRVIQILEDEGIIVSACGHWFNPDTYVETIEEITCKACLQYMEGGFTSQEKNRE